MNLNLSMNLRPNELALYDFCLIRKIVHAISYSKSYINVRKTDESIRTSRYKARFSRKSAHSCAQNLVEKTLCSRQ
jgi:hypothetical protein